MTAIELHFEAMAEADRAIDLSAKGDHEAAKKAFTNACALDTQAAEKSTDPTSRAVCYRSAAWLALDAGGPARAVALADKGLEKPAPKRFMLELESIREIAQKAVTP